MLTRLALLALAILCGTPRVFAAPKAWDKAMNGAFVLALARDGQGNLWAGTEDSGVSRLASQSGLWQKFTVKDGLGDDNAYALAVDKLGRVWAGHLNHGVSVWNGQKWQNYGVLDGPLGENLRHRYFAR